MMYHHKSDRFVMKLTLLIYSIISAGFGLSFIRYYDTSLWFANPFQPSNPHSNQSLITFHAIQAVIWTLTASSQISFGSFLKSEKRNSFKANVHRLIGKYILPIIIFMFLGSAFLILFYELIDGKTVHPTSLFLNFGACAFILTWSALGFYYIMISKQIDKHKDCMIAAFITSSVPALFRFLRLIFQLTHANLCDDVNVFPYIITTAVLTASLSVFVFWQRLNIRNIHNLLFVCSFIVPLIYPLLTMDICFDPCAQININHTN